MCVSPSFPTVAFACTSSRLTLSPAVPCGIAEKVLEEALQTAVPVLCDGVLVGLLRACDLGGASLPVARATVVHPTVVHPGDLLSSALERMVEAHVDHAVVMEDGHVVGVLSDEQAIRALASVVPDSTRPPRPGHR